MHMPVHVCVLLSSYITQVIQQPVFPQTGGLHLCVCYAVGHTQSPYSGAIMRMYYVCMHASMYALPRAHVNACYQCALVRVRKHTPSSQHACRFTLSEKHVLNATLFGKSLLLKVMSPMCNRARHPTECMCVSCRTTRVYYTYYSNISHPCV